MAAATLRNRYVNDSVSTASPAQLVVMLYDRLVLDIGQAALAQRERQREQTHLKLTHAQDIVTALANNLNDSAGPMASNLHALYTFIHQELVQANITNDPARTESVLALVEPLRDAWRQATGGAEAEAGSAGAPAIPTQQGQPGQATSNSAQQKQAPQKQALTYQAQAGRRA